MKFLAAVEPPELMFGLEVPPDVVEALGGGARPAVRIRINDHSWRSRIAIMRGRRLIGLSTANRQPAGVAIGDQVEVELALDTEPRIVVEPDDLAAALDVDQDARAAYDALTSSRRREVMRSVESAKRPETRQRCVELGIAALRD